MLRTADDPEMLHNGAIKLRSLLEARKDAWSLRYWWRLWNLEYRIAPAGARETERRRILQDVASLQEVQPVDSAEWWSVFKAAWQLTGEESIQIWVEDTILAQFSHSSSAVWAEWSRWSREHRPPARDALPEEVKAYLDLQRAFKEESGKRRPDDPEPLNEKWDELWTDARIPLSERLALVDKVALLIRKSPEWVDFQDPTFPVLVAELYVRWQTRLDEIPELIKRGIQEAESRYQYYPDASLVQLKSSTQWALDIRRRGNLALANAYLLQKKLDLARQVIEASLAELDQDNPLRSDWLYPQGRLAELEGDPVQALASYQKHVGPMARWILSGGAQSDPRLRDQVAVIKRLYLANGGSEESWPAWCTAGRGEEPVKPPSMKIEYLTELPDFEARDLSGKTWRLSDLKGKATLVDVWAATGSNSAARELPALQRFYERIKGRKDVQMLTFSIDENPYQAGRLLAEGKHTFPVIVSRTLGERLFPVRVIALAWIIDAQGRRSSSFRFVQPDLILSEMEKAAGAK